MKYTYNLANIAFKTGVAKEAMKADIELSLELKDMSISVEFSCDELTAVGQSMLAMKNAATDAVTKILPLIKEAIIDIGKVGSDEIVRHREIGMAESKIHAERRAMERKEEHSERMELIARELELEKTKLERVSRG